VGVASRAVGQAGSGDYAFDWLAEIRRSSGYNPATLLNDLVVMHREVVMNYGDLRTATWLGHAVIGVMDDLRRMAAEDARTACRDTQLQETGRAVLTSEVVPGNADRLPPADPTAEFVQYLQETAAMIQAAAA
jgi:hypothetical protein